MKMEQAVQKLSKRIGFRVAPGFSERVVFRELFPRGLTLLDLKDAGVRQLNMSNIARAAGIARADQGAEPARGRGQLLTTGGGALTSR